MGLFPTLSAARLPAALLLFAALTMGLSACKRARAEIDGIGEFKLGVTTQEQAGVCSDRGTFVYCSNNGAVPIGGQKGEVDLYFHKPVKPGEPKPTVDDKLDPSATVSEILVVVRRCKEDPIEAQLRKELGAATGQVGGTMGWVQKKATIIARLPAEKGVCEISFLHPSETERIREMSPKGMDLTIK